MLRSDLRRMKPNERAEERYVKHKICEERKLKRITGEEIQRQNAKGCFEEKGSQCSGETGQ